MVDSAVGTTTALHLAVRCAKCTRLFLSGLGWGADLVGGPVDPTVELVLQSCPFMLNAQDARGATPLHIAASLNRMDVVSLFLAQEDIDDSIKNVEGKTCADAGGGSEVAGLISGTCA